MTTAPEPPDPPDGRGPAATDQPRGQESDTDSASTGWASTADGSGDIPAAGDVESGVGNSREARYRRQLRQAEGERDQLRDRVESMQRAEAERLAAAEISRPAAIWAAGTQLADLLDLDGNVDPGLVAEAASRAADLLGTAPARSTPKPDLSQGAQATAVGGDPWEDAFRPGDQG